MKADGSGIQLESERLTEQIIGAAIEVHRALGPGLLESAYEHCLSYELGQRGLAVARQVALPVVYKGVNIDCGYRMDIVVEGRVLLEIKSIDALAAIHESQLMTYMQLSKLPVGMLMNFNVTLMKHGIVRRALTQPLLRELRALRGEQSDKP